MTPVDILTGFLGSGKTTLLSRWLRDPGLARTAVIVNEFGEIGLDHDLIATSDEQTVQLTTGCLCCAVQNDLAETLRDLDSRRRAGTVAFDRVVIETSGLADPAPILHTLMTETDLAERFGIGRVVATVDALTGAEALARYPEARKQVLLSERMLLTKTDLGEPPDALLRQLGQLNPTAPITRTGPDTSGPEALMAAGDAAGFRSRLADPGHAHTEAVSSLSVIRDKPIPANAVPLFLEGLLAHAGNRLLRVKGIVAVSEAPDTPMVVHGVQHVFHPPAWLDGWPSPDRRTRIVLIGIDLPPRWPDLLLDTIVEEVASARV